MSVPFTCGDAGALVSYLYDECEAGLRDAINAHLVGCVSCAREVDALGAARKHLVAWSPPVTELGFQMPVPAPPPQPWWRAPLPAWAQAAAAVLIFGAGLTAGWTRGPADVAPAAAVQSAAVETPDAASRAELAQLEQRLKTEMSQLRATPPSAPVVAQAPSRDEDVLRQVQTLVAESEERQRREFTLRAVELARDFEAQRRVDLATVRQTVGQFQGVTGAEIRQHREAIDRINNFITISQQGR
jgi:hypothetical protein